MSVNIYSLTLQSGGFTHVVELTTPIAGLDDFTLYVLPDGVKRLKEYTERLSVDGETRWRAIQNLHYDFKIAQMPLSIEEIVQQSEYLAILIEDGKNLIMPIQSFDRESKVFLVGRIDKPKFLCSALTMMSVDAQKIADECSFAAYTSLIEADPEAAKGLWCQLLGLRAKGKDAAHIPSEDLNRGDYGYVPNPYVFFGNPYAGTYSKEVVNYNQRRQNIDKFPQTILSFPNKVDIQPEDDVTRDFVDLCDSLTPSEKHHLILELAKEVGDRDKLRRIIDKVTGKGKKANMKIQLVGKHNRNLFISNRRPGDYQLHFIKTEENGAERREVIDIESGALIIYLMYLLYIKEHGRIAQPLDITSKTNIKAFKDIFATLYPFGYRKAIKTKGDSEEADSSDPVMAEAEEKVGQLYKSLTQKGTVARQHKTGWFDMIANCINIKCAMLKEDPTPYKVTLNCVPTITSDNIDIPDNIFKGIRIE